MRLGEVEVMCAQMTRRDILRTSALGALGVLVAACAPAPTVQEAATEAPAAEATFPPKAVEAQPVTIRLMTGTWWNGITGQEDPSQATQEDWWKFIFDEWKKAEPEYESATLALEMVSWNELEQKVNVAVAAQDWPDIYVTEAVIAIKYAQQGLLEPIDDALTVEDREDFEPAALAASMYEGKIYGWPWNGYGTCLVANKKLFEKMGATDLLPDENGFWTFDHFLEACKATTQDNVFGFSMGFKDMSGDYQRYSMIWGRGATIFSPDGKRYTFDAPEAVEGLQFLVDMEHKYQVMTPGSAGLAWADVTQEFHSARAGVIAGAQWYNDARVRTLVEQGDIDPEQVEIIPAMFPHLDGMDPPRTYAGIDAWIVFKQTDAFKRQAVMDLCSFVCSAENQHWNIAGSYLPVRKSAADMYTDDAFMRWLSRYTLAYAHPDGNHPYFKDTRAYLVPALQEAMSLQRTPQEALSAPARDINAMLEQMA